LSNIVSEAHRIAENVVGRGLLWGDVLVDVPVREREQLGAPVIVYPNMTSSVGERIERTSPVIANVRDEFGRHVKKFRIFIHPDLRDEMNTAQEEQLSKELLEMTVERTGG
jgi:hypothetical protein